MGINMVNPNMFIVMAVDKVRVILDYIFLVSFVII